MKMLIILGLRDDNARITELFKMAGVPVYSRFDTTGGMNDQKEELSDEWFAASPGTAESIAYFSFAEDQVALSALKLLKKDNEQRKSAYPLHGFIVQVEAQI